MDSRFALDWSRAPRLHALPATDRFLSVAHGVPRKSRGARCARVPDIALGEGAKGARCAWSGGDRGIGVKWKEDPALNRQFAREFLSKWNLVPAGPANFCHLVLLWKERRFPAATIALPEGQWNGGRCFIPFIHSHRQLAHAPFLLGIDLDAGARISCHRFPGVACARPGISGNPRESECSFKLKNVLT